MSVPEHWVVFVMEAVLRFGRPLSNSWAVHNLLVEMAALDDNPYDLLRHDGFFERDKRTETSECQVCGHKIVGTYTRRSTEHYLLHSQQVQFVLDPGRIEPSWKYIDDIINRHIVRNP